VIPESPMAVPHTAGMELWGERRGDLCAVGVWTEKRLGDGEDAEPLLVHHFPTGAGILGVFDGVGGAGSATEYRIGEGPLRTGAWFGSRVARHAVESWFRRVVAGWPAELEALRGWIKTVLELKRPDIRSKLVGSMRESLPSTMAAIHYRRAGDVLECRALWAGDSRAYLLDPAAGLLALTRDHCEEADALKQLRDAPPMVNSLRAHNPFYLSENSIDVRLPAVLVCVTDGFFGRLDTPAQLELHMLDRLTHAQDEHDWARLLAERVKTYTDDDATLSLVALGYANFDELRSAFKARTEHLQDNYHLPASVAEDRKKYRNWCDETWKLYRRDYERHMPRPPEEHVR